MRAILITILAALAGIGSLEAQGSSKIELPEEQNAILETLKKKQREPFREYFLRQEAQVSSLLKEVEDLKDSIEAERTARSDVEAQHQSVLNQAVEMLNGLKREGLEIREAKNIAIQLGPEDHDPMKARRVFRFDEAKPIVLWIVPIMVYDGDNVIELNRQPHLLLPAAGKGTEIEMQGEMKCINSPLTKPWFFRWKNDGIEFSAGCSYPTNSEFRIEIGGLIKSSIVDRSGMIDTLE